MSEESSPIFTPPTVYIEKIIYKSGASLSFERRQIIVFVGPNNAGKSQTLREINAWKPTQQNILETVAIKKTGTVEDVMQLVKKVSKEDENNHYIGFGFRITASTISFAWNTDTPHQLRPLFINHLSASSRLEVTKQAQSYDVVRAYPSHPVHYIYNNDGLENKISDYFRQSFGLYLIVNRVGGSTIPLHVGPKPEFTDGEDRVSVSYLKKLTELPLLEEQGDGMRSFAGILLNFIVPQFQVFLIDEPDVFLHPPQARLLGRMIGNDLAGDRQVFIATHSEYFLKGLLDSTHENIKVVRITREGNVNKVCELTNDAVKELWSNPLFRHSDILSGLFHEHVVVCESETDCRFYSAIMAAIYDEKDHFPDVLFVHCSGKHRLHVGVKALIKIGVRVSAVVDFDILREEIHFKNTFRELGGEWEDIQSSFQQIYNAIESKRKKVCTNVVKIDLSGVTFSGPDLTETDAQKVREIVKMDSPWKEAKRLGKNYLPSGQVRAAFDDLITKCQNIGLHVLELGELEQFEPHEGNHGPTWLAKVLEKGDLGTRPDLKDARCFVQRLVGDEHAIA